MKVFVKWGFVILLFLSCKGKTQKEEVSTFKVTLNILIEEDDKIEIYYLIDDMLAYNRKYRVSKKVKGKGTNQKVYFELPENEYPTSLRIDLGENQNTDQIKILGIQMEYEGVTIEFSPEEITSFFIPNRYIKYSKSTGIVKLSPHESNYDPYFDSKDLLKLRLELMKKGINL